MLTELEKTNIKIMQNYGWSYPEMAGMIRDMRSMDELRELHAEIETYLKEQKQ